MADDSATTQRKKRATLTARNRVMDLLARRDHSEQELREKLHESFSVKDIDGAIEFAHQKKWIKEGAVLAETFADEMHRKKKGLIAINHKLREIGLPTVTADPQIELKNALELAQMKVNRLTTTLDRVGREKIGRFLISRGFAPGIVRKVIYEKL